MNTQRIGYKRVSSRDQRPDLQLDGVPLDREFVDSVSGKDTSRPALQEMRAYCRAGDTLVVHSMDRLARNLADLLAIVTGLTNRGVRVQFLKEGLTFTGDDTPMARLLLAVMGAVAEFERSLIKERQAEGIALAKQRGIYRGRQPALKPEVRAELLARVEAGEPKARVARAYGVSRETVRQYIRAGKTA